MRACNRQRSEGALVTWSDRAPEVEPRDPHPLVEVQPMGIGTVRAQPGVQVKSIAVQALGLVDQPVDQLARVAMAPVVEPGAQVVALEGVAPPQLMDNPQPCP